MFGNILWCGRSQNQNQVSPAKILKATGNEGAGQFWRCINNLIVETSNKEEKTHSVTYSVTNALKDSITGLNQLKDGKVVLQTTEKTVAVNLAGLIEHKLGVGEYEQAAVVENGLNFALITSSYAKDSKEHWLTIKKKFKAFRVKQSADIILSSLDQQRTLINRLTGLTSDEQLCRFLFKNMTQNCTIDQLKLLVASMQTMELKLQPVQIAAIKTKTVFQTIIKITAQVIQHPIVRLVGSIYLAYKIYHFAKTAFDVIAIFIFPAVVGCAKRNLPPVVYNIGKAVYDYRFTLWVLSLLTGVQVLSVPSDIVMKVRDIPYKVAKWVFFNSGTGAKYLGATIEGQIDSSEAKALIENLKTAEEYWVHLAKNVE